MGIKLTPVTAVLVGILAVASATIPTVGLYGRGGRGGNPAVNVGGIALQGTPPITVGGRGSVSVPNVELPTPEKPTVNAWGSWSSWSACSKSCDGGVQTRTRTCGVAYGNEHFCSGPSKEERACNEQPCPVDGGWSQWSEGSCSGVCGVGIAKRTRTCTAPAPAYGGAGCQGSDSEEIECDTGKPCPVDGGWSNWSSWSSCSRSCGGGRQVRRRICNEPKPANGGADCNGRATQTRGCNHGSCRNGYY